MPTRTSYLPCYLSKTELEMIIARCRRRFTCSQLCSALYLLYCLAARAQRKLWVSVRLPALASLQATQQRHEIFRAGSQKNNLRASIPNSFMNETIAKTKTKTMTTIRDRSAGLLDRGLRFKCPGSFGHGWPLRSFPVSLLLLSVYIFR